MKLVLFGATGHLGGHLLRQALTLGHTVTTFSRDPEAVSPHAQVRRLSGTVLDRSAVTEAIRGQDAVLSALGSGSSPAGFDVITAGAAHIVQGMQAHGVDRLIATAAAGILNLSDEALVRDAPGFPGALRPVSAAHLEAYHTLLASPVNWTLLCPPRMVEQPGNGQYRVQGDQAFLDGQQISLEDAAQFVLEELARPQYIRRRVAIAQ